MHYGHNWYLKWIHASKLLLGWEAPHGDTVPEERMSQTMKGLVVRWYFWSSELHAVTWSIIASGRKHGLLQSLKEPPKSSSSTLFVGEELFSWEWGWLGTLPKITQPGQWQSWDFFLSPRPWLVALCCIAFCKFQRRGRAIVSLKIHICSDYIWFLRL